MFRRVTGLVFTAGFSGGWSFMSANSSSLFKPTSPPADALALRSRDAAKLLGISERTLWTWVQQKRIPHVRVGGCILFPKEALTRWLSEEAAATVAVTQA
jgi:excisionase family DNA binding protein